MKNKLISIIVPVYNTSDYLEKCINSIINQTYKNIEIIIIDDGSTDNSADIIKRFIDIDERVVCYYQPNRGVATARNKGIELSKGDYILFIDSDDYVEPTIVEKLLGNIGEDDIFCMCGTISVYENNIKENYVKKEFVDTFRGIATYKRLINKNILLKSNIKFSNLKICEDLEFYSKLLIYNNMKYTFINECLYYYVQRKDSLIHQYNINQEDTIKAVTNIIDYCKKNNKYELYKDKLEFLFIIHIIGGYFKRNILNGINEIELKKLYLKTTKLFPNWYENKYLNKDGYIPKIYLEYIESLKNNNFKKAILDIKNI